MIPKLTVIALTAHIRRGPNTTASRIADAKVGDQFDVIQLLAMTAPEQWAKIRLPNQQNVDAYICVTMPSGVRLCQVDSAAVPGGDDYRRGWNDCLEALHLHLVTLRK